MSTRYVRPRQPGKTTRDLEAIADVAEVEWTGLRLYDEQEQGLRLVAAVGAGLEEQPPVLILKDTGRISGEAFELGQTVVVNDYPSYPKADPVRVGDGIKSAVSLLLKTGGRVVGTLNVNSREPGHFTPERVRFLSAIADGMGVLLDNARLLDDLQDGEERYYTLFEQSRDAIFISRRGQVMDCNQACLDLFGYQRDELPELNNSDLYADLDEHVKFSDAMHEQGSVQDFEVRFKKRDGTEMDCLVSATLLRDEHGNEVGVHGIVRDITERIRAEQAVRDSEAEARRRADQMRAINDIAVTVSSILSLEELLPYVVTLLRDTFGYYSVNIGLIDVDFLARDDALRGATIAESTAAQRGFMGLNRGAVGVWGSAVIAYCASRLMLASRLGIARSVVYTMAVTLTAVVVLFSGSRTGTVACAAAGGYVGLKVVSQLRRARLARLILFGAVGAIAGQQLLAPGLTMVSQRVGTLKSFGTLQSLQSRLEVQGDTIRQVLRDGRSALLGMGADMALFKRLVGKLSHPHSEYILALWQTGVPGLLLYLLFLALLFSRMHARSRDDPDAIYLAGEAMLVAGMVAGLAVGNILTVAGRLAPFGMTMLFVFGRLIRPTPSGDRPMQLPRAVSYSRYPY
ncbi:MAG: PAS domain S-box protein [Planctomycetes bacterium]|nr:PAS domain S-box protein [Planctomycetota bacterium]